MEPLRFFWSPSQWLWTVHKEWHNVKKNDESLLVHHSKKNWTTYNSLLTFNALRTVAVWWKIFHSCVRRPQWKSVPQEWQCVTLDTNRLSGADIRKEATKINLLNHGIICDDNFIFVSHTTLNLVKVTLRPTISRPGRLDVRRQRGTRDQFFFLLESFF
jgi:hypothetical protein